MSIQSLAAGLFCSIFLQGSKGKGEQRKMSKIKGTAEPRGDLKENLKSRKEKKLFLRYETTLGEKQVEKSKELFSNKAGRQLS